MGGKSTRIGAYKCYNCRKPFSVKVGGHNHLNRYLAEFDFRYNNRVALGVNDIELAENRLRLFRLLKHGGGITLPDWIRDHDAASPVSQRSLVTVLHSFQISAKSLTQSKRGWLDMNICNMPRAIGERRDRVKQCGANDIAYLNACMIFAMPESREFQYAVECRSRSAKFLREHRVGDIYILKVISAIGDSEAKAILHIKKFIKKSIH